MKLLDIGYGNAVNPDKVVAVISADAAPTKRMVNAARERNTAVDATCGKKTKSVFVTDSGYVILSAKSIESFTKLSGTNEIK